MTDIEFIIQMNCLNEEHRPDGYPCIRMSDINRLLIIIDRLRLWQHNIASYVEIDGRGKCISNESAHALADEIRIKFVL